MRSTIEHAIDSESNLQKGYQNINMYIHSLIIFPNYLVLPILLSNRSWIISGLKICRKLFLTQIQKIKPKKIYQSNGATPSHSGSESRIAYHVMVWRMLIRLYPGVLSDVLGISYHRNISTTAIFINMHSRTLSVIHQQYVSPIHTAVTIQRE